MEYNFKILEQQLKDCDVELLEFKALLQSYKTCDSQNALSGEMDSFANAVVDFTNHVSTINRQLKALNTTRCLEAYAAKKTAEKRLSNASAVEYPQDTAALLNKRLGQLRIADGTRFRGEIKRIVDPKTNTFYVFVYDKIHINLDVKKLNAVKEMPDRNDVFVVTGCRGEVAFRAKLRPNFDAGDGLRVLLIDCGREVNLNKNHKLYECPEVYQTIPPLAIKCRLMGVDRKEPDEIQFLGAVLHYKMGQRCVFEVIEALENIVLVLLRQSQPNEEISKFRVILRKGLKSNENGKMFDLWEEVYNPDKPNEPFSFYHWAHSMLTPSRFKAGRIILKVTVACSPTTFFAQIVNGQDQQLQAISWYPDELSISDLLLKKPKLYDIVRAKYEDVYYRARIIRIVEDDLFEVFFFDYGNKACVPQSFLAKYPISEGEVEYMAVFCRFGEIADIPGQDPAAFRKGTKALEKMLQYRTVVVSIAEKRPKNELVVVVVDPEWFHVPQVMVDEGHAMIHYTTP